MTDPILDLLVLDTYNPFTMGVADLSQYPANFNIISPTLQIAATSLPTVAVTFSSGGIAILNSENLGITTSGQDPQKLPDGLYRLKYTVNPAYKYYVEKTFMRTDLLQEKFDQAFMKADFTAADSGLKRSDKNQLDDIYLILQESIAAANKCAHTLSINLYRKAEKLLDQFINAQSGCC